MVSTCKVSAFSPSPYTLKPINKEVGGRVIKSKRREQEKEQREENKSRKKERRGASRNG